MTTFCFVLKENNSIVKSIRNLDAKCEVQMCLFFFFAIDANKQKEKKRKLKNHSKLYDVHNG